MTLDQFIDRLIDLRRITGGDIDVGRAVDDGTNCVFEIAAAEIQNVIPETELSETGEKRWRCEPGPVNTARIISVF